MIGSLTSCTKEDIDTPEKSICSNVSIRIINNSGSHIDEFNAYDASWTPLAINDVITEIYLKELTLYGGFPLVYFEAAIGQIVYASMANTHWCGTSMYQVTEGAYIIELNAPNIWTEDYLGYTHVVE